MKNYDLEKRRLVLSAVAIGIVVIYVLRLFALQIASDDYRKSADSNAFLKRLSSHHVVLSQIGMVSCWYITSQLMTSWWLLMRWLVILIHSTSVML